MPFRTTRLALGAVALLALAACSSTSPGSSAAAPGPGQVHFTSESGRISINVPEEWELATSEASEAMTVFSDAELTVEGAWDFDGGKFFGGSSATITTYENVPGDTATLAKSSFDVLESIFGGAETTRGTFTTNQGILFERLDLTFEIPGGTAYEVEFIAVVDHVGIEVTFLVLDGGSATIDEIEAVMKGLVIR